MWAAEYPDIPAFSRLAGRAPQHPKLRTYFFVNPKLWPSTIPWLTSPISIYNTFLCPLSRANQTMQIPVRIRIKIDPGRHTIIIWCPFETSASTAGGVIETLYSFFFISLGTPIIMDSPPEGSRIDKFTILGVEAPVWQGAKTQEYLDIPSFRNAARRDGSADKMWSYFWVCLQPIFIFNSFLYS